MQENLFLVVCVIFILWYLLGFSSVCLVLFIATLLLCNSDNQKNAINANQKKGGYESNGIYIEDPVIREI